MGRRLLVAYVLLTLTGCVDPQDLHYERYVPAEIPLGPLVFANADIGMCSVQVFSLEPAFARRLQLEGAEILHDARISRSSARASLKGLEQVSYANWLPVSVMNSGTWDALDPTGHWTKTNPCLESFSQDRRSFSAMMEEYYFGKREGYLTLSRNKGSPDLLLLLPSDGIVIVDPYRL